jgi:hypothetical protein
MDTKPNITFAICCLGIGHFTQAITVANYIKDKYNFKYIGCVCPVDVNEVALINKIKQSVLYKDAADISIFKIKTLQTHEVNNISKVVLSQICYTIINMPEYMFYFTKHNIELVIDFFTNFIPHFGCPTLRIARQYISMKQYLDNPLIHSMKKFNNANLGICISIDDICELHRNSIVDFDIPPLINTTEIQRNIIPNTCLVYIRDAHYCNDLNMLIKNNPAISFSVFTNHVAHIEPFTNVYISVPSDEFKDKLATTQIIITSSGVETVCEAFYNDIPIVVFCPDEGDKEQSYNYNYYIKSKMAVPFTNNIDLLNISEQRPDNTWFKTYCKTANDKIHKVITHVTKRPSIIKSIFDSIRVI